MPKTPMPKIPYEYTPEYLASVKELNTEENQSPERQANPELSNCLFCEYRMPWHVFYKEYDPFEWFRITYSNCRLTVKYPEFDPVENTWTDLVIGSGGCWNIRPCKYWSPLDKLTIHTIDYSTHPEYKICVECKYMWEAYDGEKQCVLHDSRTSRRFFDVCANARNYGKNCVWRPRDYPISSFIPKKPFLKGKEHDPLTAYPRVLRSRLSRLLRFASSIKSIPY